MIRLTILLATTALAAATQAATTAPVPAGRPTIGSFGFDTAGMDRAVAPGDDFYRFASGKWVRATAIPADKSSYGSFHVLHDLSEKRTHAILDEAAADRASKIGAAYAAYLDQPAIEARGLAPIRPWLDQIKAVRSAADLPALYARASVLGIDTPFSTGVGQDDKDPETYVVGLSQSGIGLPDLDYYLQTDAKMVETRAKYVAHLTKVLTLAGEPDADARASAIMAFETSVAKAHWTRVDSRDADKTYNKLTLAQLATMGPGFDFRAYLAGQRAPVESAIVAQPSAIAATAKLVAAAPIGVLRDQLLIRSLDQYAGVLPSAFDKERFAFFDGTLSGTPEQEVRWKRAVAFTEGALGDDVSQVYVQRYFPPATKAAADSLVKNVIAAMGHRIDQLDWMSPATKVQAHAKLAAFTPKIGYPDKWRDLSGLTIDRTDALGNAMRSAEFEHDYSVGKLGQPLRRWEWGMTPMEVNAYANFGMVEIVFPAAILQPPFFDPNADAAVNYGGIGAVIGHELSHHFDDQGAKYDRTGKLSKWWTDADNAAFQSRLDALGKQFDAYEPLPGIHVQGKLTMGENVADLAGLTIAHDAYIASLGGKKPPVIGGMTGDQRFYLGWAQVWRQNIRDAAARQRLVTDPHSPTEYRADIVRNMDPWNKAFAVKAGQKLYLAPNQRVRIW